MPCQPTALVFGHSFVHHPKSFVPQGCDAKVKRDLNLSVDFSFERFSEISNADLDAVVIDELRHFPAQGRQMLLQVSTSVESQRVDHRANRWGSKNSAPSI